MTQKQKEAAAYLSQYQNLLQLMQGRMEEIRHWREVATAMHGSVDKEGKSGHRTDKIQLAVDKISTIEQQLGEDMERLIETKANIEEAIHKVENFTLQNLLQMHYLNQKTMEETALAMHYSLRHVQRLHMRALDQLCCCNSEREGIAGGNLLYMFQTS